MSSTLSNWFHWQAHNSSEPRGFLIYTYSMHRIFRVSIKRRSNKIIVEGVYLVIKTLSYIMCLGLPIRLAGSRRYRSICKSNLNYYNIILIVTILVLKNNTVVITYIIKIIKWSIKVTTTTTTATTTTTKKKNKKKTCRLETCLRHHQQRKHWSVNT